MSWLVDILSPITGLLVALGLLAVSGIILTGRRRRRQWTSETQRIDGLEGTRQEEQLERIERVQRATDFLNDALIRLYYLIAVLSAAILILLPFFPIELGRKRGVYLALTGIEFLGALTLLWHWHGWDDDRESLLRRKLRKAKEEAHLRRGLAVRDELTGLYTLDYWLHSLELQMSRILRKPVPISSLMIDITGLPDLRTRRGVAVADDLVVRVSKEITRNIRASDLVCRYRGQRFIVALMRCPEDCGRIVADRVTRNISLVALEGENKSYGSNLSLQWALATMPGQASSPMQLLRVSEAALDLKKSLVLVLDKTEGETRPRAR